MFAHAKLDELLSARRQLRRAESEFRSAPGTLSFLYEQKLQRQRSNAKEREARAYAALWLEIDHFILDERDALEETRT